MTGLITGNVEAATHIKLHRANLNRFFSFGGYGSDSNDRGEVARAAVRRAAIVYGEDLAAKQAIALGDTPLDAEGAHAAGMKCVGVASGHFDEQQLRDGGADYVISSLQEPFPL